MRRRRATELDGRALTRMLDRCSPATLRSRFHPAIDHAQATRWLSSALENPAARLWVVEDRAGRVVAVGEVARDKRTHEIALLVADAWQRTGVAMQLTSHIIADLRADGIETIRATTRVEGLPAVRRLARRLGIHVEKSTIIWGEAELHLALD
jgi:N-acetylglutamate synthase-like GNAT family acetyltransferase